MIYYGQPGPFAENVEETVIAACREVLERDRGEALALGWGVNPSNTSIRRVQRSWRGTPAYAMP